MKQKSLFFMLTVFISVLSLSSCIVINTPDSVSAKPVAASTPAQSSDTTTSSNPVLYSIADYYPFVPNQAMVYQGFGNEFAAFTAYPDYIFENRMQLRVSNGGTETIRVIEISDGQLSEVFEESEVYYKLNRLDTSKTNEALLKEPLVVGTSWKLNDGSTRAITAVDMPVSTPYGEFNALEVTTTRADSLTKDYYAPNTGLIKTVFGSGDDEISSALAKIIFNSSYTFPFIALYYPEMTDTEVLITQRDEQIHLFTNQDATPYFEQTFVSMHLMSANSRINDMTLDEASGIAHIDFSKTFLSEMNAGSEAEAAIIQCVVNTVGSYFQVNKVMLTIDGDAYSSGHIYQESGEWFEVSP